MFRLCTTATHPEKISVSNEVRNTKDSQEPTVVGQPPPPPRYARRRRRL